MAAQDAGAEPRRRPDPFAFPSDTDFRFGLLVVAVLSATFFVYGAILPNGSLLNVYRTCLRGVIASTPARSGGSSEDALANAAASTQLLGSCRATAERSRVDDELLALTGVGGLAVAIYAVLPIWRRRRGGYVALTAGDAPEVVAEIERLADAAGVGRRPRLLWNPFNGSAAAIAFGALGRYQLGLSGGLVIRFYEDPAAFRAVLRHELAHIRNGDIDKTYLTVAVWYAFVAGALVPFGVNLAFIDHSFLGDTFWRVAGLAVVVYLIRNSVLRARESYADVRASFEDGPRGVLARMIGESGAVRGGPWRRLWSVHPSPAERQETVADTARLFRLTFWDACAVGVTIGLAFPNLELAIGLWSLGFDRSGGVLSYGLTALLLSALLVGAVGPAVWRSAFLSLVGRRPPLPLLPIAFGVAAGAVAGHVLTLASSADLYGSAAVGLVEVSVVEAIWAILLTVGTLAFLRWVWAGAESWLRRAPSARHLRRAMTGGMIAAFALCVPWIGAMFLLRGFVEFALNGGPQAAAGVAALVIGLGSFVVLESPPFTALLCIAAGFLLAARLVPRPAASDGGWRYGFIEDGPGLVARDDASGSEVRGVVAGALVGLGVYVALMVPTMIGWHTAKPRSSRTDVDVLTFYALLVILAALVQGYVSAAIVVRGGPRPALRGLVAALLAGFGMGVALLVTNRAFGGGLDPGFAVQTVCTVVNGGALLALLTLPLARLSRRSGPVLTAAGT